ncbi:hypothetical protein D3C73_1478500 [compost metagenome]
MAVLAAFTDRDAAPEQIRQGEARRGLAHCGTFVHGQRAHRRHPLVQHTDLPGQCQDDQHQAKHHAPQQEIGNDQGIHMKLHQRFRSLRCEANK